MPKKTPATPPPSPHIADEVVSNLETTINASIHELVFALHHLEDDNIEDAQNCLTTVGMNVDNMQELILSNTIH